MSIWEKQIIVLYLRMFTATVLLPQKLTEEKKLHRWNYVSEEIR